MAEMGDGRGVAIFAFIVTGFDHALTDAAASVINTLLLLIRNVRSTQSNDGRNSIM